MPPMKRHVLTVNRMHPRRKKRISRNERVRRIYKTLYTLTMKGKKGTSAYQLAAWHHLSEATIRRYLREIQKSLQKMPNQRMILKDGRWLVISLQAEEAKRSKVQPVAGRTVFLIVQMDSEPTQSRPLHLKIGRIVPRN